MKTEGIIKYLKLQDSNLDFYKREKMGGNVEAVGAV